MRLMIILRASRAIIPYLLERCWGLNSDTARRLGSVLSQGVEFAFVLLATDVIQGVISEPIANLLRLAVTLLMAPVRDPRHRRSQKSLPRHPRRHLEAAGRQDRKLTSGCAGFWGARRLLRELTPMLGAIYRRLEFGLILYESHRLVRRVCRPMVGSDQRTAVPGAWCGSFRRQKENPGG